MQWFEPLIIIAVVSFVGLVFFFHFYNRKKGKKSCCDDCCTCQKKCGINCKKILEDYHKNS